MTEEEIEERIEQLPYFGRTHIRALQVQLSLALSRHTAKPNPREAAVRDDVLGVLRARLPAVARRNSRRGDVQYRVTALADAPDGLVIRYENTTEPDEAPRVYVLRIEVEETE